MESADAIFLEMFNASLHRLSFLQMYMLDAFIKADKKT
jgi:hypothetical protein